MAVARADTILTKAFGAITNAYTTIGSPLSNNWRIFCITNNTNGDMLFSFNGSTDNIFIPAGGFRLYDLATNSPPVNESDNFVLALLTQFYVKYNTAPASGAVWIEGIYARGQ